MSPRHATTTMALAALSLGLGFALGTVPNNSVGSPQLKNGQVKSVDLQDGGVTTKDVKNGSLTAGDLAPGTTATQTSLAGTKATFNCSGWCYLANSGTGTVTASFDTQPPGTGTSWKTTGPLTLTQASDVQISATANIWFFGSSNLDIICTLYDGTTGLGGTGWIRSNGNEAQTVSFEERYSLAAGDHPLHFNCRAGTVNNSGVTDGSMTAVIVPSA